MHTRTREPIGKALFLALVPLCRVSCGLLLCSLRGALLWRHGSLSERHGCFGQLGIAGAYGNVDSPSCRPHLKRSTRPEESNNGIEGINTWKWHKSEGAVGNESKDAPTSIPGCALMICINRGSKIALALHPPLTLSPARKTSIISQHDTRHTNTQQPSPPLTHLPTPPNRHALSHFSPCSAPGKPRPSSCPAQMPSAVCGMTSTVCTPSLALSLCATAFSDPSPGDSPAPAARRSPEHTTHFCPNTPVAMAKGFAARPPQLKPPTPAPAAGPPPSKKGRGRPASRRRQSTKALLPTSPTSTYCPC